MQLQQGAITGTVKPQYRFRLKARIHEVGFIHNKEFAKAIGYDEATVSRVLNGWWLPTVRMQGRMADVLNMSLRELQTLL